MRLDVLFNMMSIPNNVGLISTRTALVRKPIPASHSGLTQTEVDMIMNVDLCCIIQL